MRFFSQQFIDHLDPDVEPLVVDCRPPHTAEANRTYRWIEETYGSYSRCAISDRWINKGRRLPDGFIHEPITI